MRIIDKITDYYDYLQDPTDKLVFDRRGSFLLTKELFCEKMRLYWRYQDSKYRLVLLQCGATFWLFLVTLTEIDKSGKPTGYSMELLTSWKNYDKKRELLKMDLVTMKSYFGIYDWRSREYVYKKILARASDIKNAIIHGDYKVEQSMGTYTKVTSCKGRDITEELHIPILKACGIGSIIEPLEMFCAIEEHFSLEKTASERTDAIGSTNDDKIAMHGFDTKTSFRGKRQ